MSDQPAATPLAGRRLHFIAIGGAGMSGLALICSGLGARVTGSDRADSSYMSRLREAGLEPRVGHDPDAVPEDAEVVVSTAIADDNPELVRARDRRQRVLHRGELLAELTAAGRLIAVAGAHGKTTTSGMIAHALLRTGADPTFILGGELLGAGAGGAAANAGCGTGGVIVAEADESDGSFLRLQPDVALVTNVELDHHAHWSGEAALWQAFAGFCGAARGGRGRRRARPATGRGAVVRDRGRGRRGGRGLHRRRGPPRGGRQRVRAALSRGHAAGAPAGSRPAQRDQRDRGAGGAVQRRGWAHPACAQRAGRGERSGALIFDDYAHHPTEVAATLAALRELPQGRLIAVFQPHLYSRTKALAGRFGRALATADLIGVLDVYAAREQPVGELEGVSGLDVVRAAAEACDGRRVLWLSDIETADRVLAPELEAGDVLVTIGAGNVFELAERLLGERRP
jgi:UDP-N-acetylmuramate--alanine ligase